MGRDKKVNPEEKEITAEDFTKLVEARTSITTIKIIY